MSDMVQIRSVKQYFNDFIVKELKGKEKVDQTDLIPIKAAILKEFKNEVFGQIYFKLGDEAKTMSRDDLAKIDAVHNILHQEVRKWKRFCVLCSEYGLGTFFGLRDLERKPGERLFAPGAQERPPQRRERNQRDEGKHPRIHEFHFEASFAVKLRPPRYTNLREAAI